DEIAAPEAEPDAVVVARETIELAFLAVIQVLPARQRAVLILRDVLAWPAAGTAGTLGMSVAAVNSALQRARATLQDKLPSDRLEWAASDPTEQERALLAAFIDAHERADPAAAVAMMCEDIRVTMPPSPVCYDGACSARRSVRGRSGGGRWVNGRWWPPGRNG